MFEWSVASRAVAEGSVSPLALVRALEALGDLDLLGMDADAALAVVEIVQSATSCLSGISALATEALARRECEQVARERDDRRRRGERGGGPTGEDLAVGSLAPTLHLTPRSTGGYLDEVRTLVNHLPRTFALVRAGRLDLHRAGAVASEAALVAPAHRDAFDQDVTAAPRGRRRVPLVDLTPGGVHRRAAGVAVRVDPESAAARSAAALDERFVRVRPGVDPGVTSWSASLPSDTSLTAWAAVEALATQYATADPSRRIDQARADALLDLVLAQATVTTTIELVVPLDPAQGPEATRGPTSASAPDLPTTPAREQGPGQATPQGPGTSTCEGGDDGGSSDGGDGGVRDGRSVSDGDGNGDGDGSDGGVSDGNGNLLGRRLAGQRSRRRPLLIDQQHVPVSPWERHLHLVVVDGIEIELHDVRTSHHGDALVPPPDHLPDQRPSGADGFHPPVACDGTNPGHDGRGGDDRRARDAHHPQAGQTLDELSNDLLLTEPPTEEHRDPGVGTATLDPSAHDPGAHDPSPHVLPARVGGPRAGDDTSLRDGDAGAQTVAGLPRCEVGVRHPRVGILLNAAITAWLADPDTRIRLHGHDLRTGAVVAHDPSTYRPNQRLARVVRARDGHCRFPGCTTDAARCQLDHVVPFPTGPTALDNLACLCARHHRFKHSSGWTLAIDDDGACTWTSPYGRTHLTRARSTDETAA